MEDYARTVLMEMLTTTATGPDLAGVLGPWPGQRPALDALIEGLKPVVAALLQVTLGLGGRMAAGTASLGQAEEELRTRGRDLMRDTLQAVADAASAAQERVPGGVDGPDGVRRTRVEDGHARTVATVFGRITVSRLAYRGPGVGNVHPLDEVLDLPDGLYSTGLARLSAREAVRGSFIAATDAVEYVTGVRIGTRQLIELTRAAASDVAGFYTARQAPAADPGDALVITADGKGIPVRPGALRPGTARLAARAKQMPPGATSGNAGGKGNSKRMAELVCVYDLKPVPRTVEDILPALADGAGSTDGEEDRQAPAQAPKAAGKWLTASVTDDIPAVISAGFDEATRRDPGHVRDWVALVDGNCTQIDAITAEASTRGVEVTVLIDWLHVSGYLWDAAKAFFCTETTTGMALARAWVHERSRIVLQGGALQVAERIRARILSSRLTAAQRKSALEAATYLTNKAPHLDYPAALAKGWPIATGVIEGACRHLVKDRLEITGARWGLDTAEAILTLRATVTNGDFDDYWQHHEQQQHHRTYPTTTRPDLPVAA
ncbi:MAG TPA: ISKra4 family transposase [Kineosporiaceae bacterium]